MHVKETFTWKIKDKTLHGFYYASQDSKPKAVVLLVHGMGEHSGRYSFFEKHCSDKNYALVSFDHIGHGLSEGKRGHILSYEIFMQSISNLVDTATNLFPDIPKVLMGHSLGGNLVLYYFLTQDISKISGVIVSAPWLRLSKSPGLLKVSAAKLLHKVIPGFVDNTNLTKNALSRDDEYNKNYYSDPLVHHFISIRLFTEVHKKAQWMLKQKHHLQKPLLLYHGDADKITDYKGSTYFYDSLDNKSKVYFHILKGGYHEPHNDIDKQKVFNLIDTFIEKNIL